MTKSKKCKSCQQPFTPKQWFQRFCSAACRLKAWRKAKKSTK